jgi:hypothetical protein
MLPVIFHGCESWPLTLRGEYDWWLELGLQWQWRHSLCNQLGDYQYFGGTATFIFNVEVKGSTIPRNDVTSTRLHGVSPEYYSKNALRMSENKMLRKIFRPEREEVTGCCWNSIMRGIIICTLHSQITQGRWLVPHHQIFCHKNTRNTVTIFHCRVEQFTGHGS